MTPHEERTEQHREHVEAKRPHLDLKESQTPVSRTADAPAANGATHFFPLDGGHSSSAAIHSPEPKGPEVEPILSLHRGADSFVSFHRKEPEWRNLYSVQVSALENLFPSFREELEADAYFSVNGFCRHGGQDCNASPRGPAYRKANALHYLNAAFADLDCYKLGFTPGAVIGRVTDLMRQGTIPPISMLALSGRGVWLFWFLHEPGDPDKPQRAWPEKTLLYWEVQRALGGLLADLGADAQARDTARVTRVPGSLNTVARKRAAYFFPADTAGHRFTYTLHELAEHLGISLCRHPVVRKALDHAESKPQRAKGWVALHRGRLAQFEILRGLRGGGFDEGCRNWGALLYAHLLARNQMPRQDLIEHVCSFGSACCPPLSNAECLGAVREGWKQRHFKNQTIATILKITARESQELAGTFDGEAWDPAGVDPCRPRYTRREVPKRQEIAARQAAIQQLILELGRVPPLREMAELLEGKGFTARKDTVRQGYRQIGIESPRSREARKRQRESQKPLLLKSA